MASFFSHSMLLMEILINYPEWKVSLISFCSLFSRVFVLILVYLLVESSPFQKQIKPNTIHQKDVILTSCYGHTRVLIFQHSHGGSFPGTDIVVYTINKYEHFFTYQCITITRKLYLLLFFISEQHRLRKLTY